ncbi:glycosyl transferase family 2 [Hydrogenispora ethanolica]|uniref:Glycosyl transferase family 2 n=1 Tax=Hydrogenispora ethanolica TaxID=1082276 RepID=A0A4R1RU92_HYDET|nr:glycosyltransferase family 2 protein [Hydrogenispora ethanolica]TCL69954.1 glycosyl transferase family 2 [Hydrogenispora ethanolica]
MSAISVSLCVIARDEAAVIADCLNSARPFVTEMIVVDTGSTDRTRELSVALGARVFDWDWSGDFAAARNYGLEQAESAWILVLDADETLEPTTTDDFQTLLRDTRIEGYYLTIRSQLENHRESIDYVVRLFRNKPIYRFDGIIHEQVAGSILRHNNGSGLVKAPLLINHSGYRSEVVRRKDKHCRNIRLIEQALNKSPQDPFLLYSLGMEHYQEGRLENGLVFLERALTLLHGEEGFFHEILLAVGVGLWLTERLPQLAVFLERAFRMLPEDPDLHWLMSLLAFRKKNYQSALSHLRQSFGTTLAVEPSKSILDDDLLSLRQHLPPATAACHGSAAAETENPIPWSNLLELKKRSEMEADWPELAACIPAKRQLAEHFLSRQDLPLAWGLLLLQILQCVTERQWAEADQTCRRLVETTGSQGWAPPLALNASCLNLLGQEIMIRLALHPCRLPPEPEISGPAICKLLHWGLDLTLHLTIPAEGYPEKEGWTHDQSIDCQPGSAETNHPKRIP